MKRHFRIYLVIAMLLAFIPSTVAYAGWEYIEQVRVDPSDDERIDVEVRDSFIYITTNKPLTVKVCTILGQLVSQEKIPAGVSRIRLAQRGVYILKAGTVTRRVNI
ncbi:MAG: hypothetical protein K2G24_05720 [Muribaculaceae bacterium]|nr:hypothetical protein [Muribaculaceae bacterium]